MKVKELIFITCVFVFLIAASLVLFLKLGSHSEVTRLSEKDVLNVLFVIDDGGEAISTNLISYYTGNNRGSMIDIPANTALILQSLGRTDGIGAVYHEKGLPEYTKEVEKFLNLALPFQVKIDLKDFAYFTDMLGGISVFIPNSVEVKTETDLYLLPSGYVKLDGEKILQYMLYEENDEDAGAVALRKQNAVLAFLRACNENAKTFFSDSFFKSVEKKVLSNLRGKELKKLIEQIAKIDTERVVPQRVSGALKTTADGKELLFPVNDGAQIKEVVKQTLSSLASEEGVVLERVYVLQILNATDRIGLAKNTSEIFQSFGYDVASIDNAKELRDKTIVIDRIGNAAVAKVVADVISCKNILSPETSEEFSGTESAVDFTVILGADFNGTQVVNRK